MKILLLCMVFFALPAAAAPKLVVTLVIDQFRADNLTRFEPRFLPAKGGGFRYLMERGAYFPFAQYDILQPMTGPGHATILTGTYPYLGGIPLNDWYDPETKDKHYCVEDSAYATVGQSEARPHLGTSPRAFLGTTLGDELKNSGHASKVFTVAIKDRAAILLGGHRADLALWLDGSSQTWVSSRFYLPGGKLPAWVNRLNERLRKRAGQSFLWQLPPQPETSLAIFNVKRYGGYLGAIGETFPHKVTYGTPSELTSPAGLDLTVEAAEATVEENHLGQGKGVDLLAVSFSSHDYVGHAFGPDSRENEEMVVAEDRALARFFSFLDRKVGLKNVLISFTGDHGVAPNAEWLAAHRVNAGAVSWSELDKKLEAGLVAKFGSAGKEAWIARSQDFNYWVNRAALKEKGIELEPVADELKRLLLLEKPFAFAFTARDVVLRQLPPGMHERRILKTFFAGRSGDVVGIVRPFFYIEEHTTNHMADYSYDETVPLAIAGPGIRAGKYATRAEVVDLAPTLSFLLGTVPPSLSEGRVLSEAIGTGGK